MKTLAQELAPLAGTYSPGFIDLMAFVMPHECEFLEGHHGDYDLVAVEHDPHDPGGTTMYGLDARSHPHVDVAHLSFDEACAIYFAEIWEPLRCDEIDPEVALVLCDAAINCGSVRAVRWLQTIVNPISGDDDFVDGSFGRESIAATNSQPPHGVALAFNARRLSYYQTEVRPALQKLYLSGWESRVNDLNAILV